MSTGTSNYNFQKPLVNNATDADIWGGYLNDNWDDVDSILNTRTQNYDFAGYDITEAELSYCSERYSAPGNVSGAVSVDYEDGHWQTLTLTGNVTSLTISNWPASGTGSWITLELIQDGTGGRTITLGSAYKTAGGAGITLSTAAGSVDLLHLTTRNQGTTIFTRLEADFK